MHLPNPIYDEVFERLLDDPEPARLIFGTILGEEVALVPDETAARVELTKSTLSGIDLAATVRTAGGERLRVLIEVHLRRLAADERVAAATELAGDIAVEWQALQDKAGRDQTVAGREETIAEREETIRRQQAEIETPRRRAAGTDDA